MTESSTTIGRRISLARKRREWTQQNLADKMYVTRQTVARLEKGEPTVSIGLYLLAAWILDESFLNAFIAPENDRKGMSLDLFRAESKQRIR